MKKIYTFAVLAFAIAVLAMPGIAADFTLRIFGNANLDDTINEKDVSYVNDVISGKEGPTEFSDANYDGTIDAKDVLQIEQIINGSEKKIVIKDDDGDAIIIKEPVARVVAPGRIYGACEAMRSMNATNLLVGVCKEIQDRPIFYPELSKLPGIGTAWEPDYEAIISLNPDLVITSGTSIPSGGHGGTLNYKEKLSGITPVIYLALEIEENYSERVKMLGYIFNSEEAADEYIQWHDSIIDEIKSKTESLPDEEKPRVFPTFYSQAKGTWNAYGADYGSVPEMCTLAGGKNIGDDLPTSGHPEVDLEWIAEQDPEVIVLKGSFKLCGYQNPTDYLSVKDLIVNTPLLSNVSAVKNDRVYVMCGDCFEYSGSRVVMIAMWAKWFHPEIFKDLNPTAIHQEYLDKFQKIDFNVSENIGQFVLAS